MVTCTFRKVKRNLSCTSNVRTKVLLHLYTYWNVSLRVVVYSYEFMKIMLSNPKKKNVVIPTIKGYLKYMLKMSVHKTSDLKKPVILPFRCQ